MAFFSSSKTSKRNPFKSLLYLSVYLVFNILFTFSFFFSTTNVQTVHAVRKLREGCGADGKPWKPRVGCKVKKVPQEDVEDVIKEEPFINDGDGIGGGGVGDDGMRSFETEPELDPFKIREILGQTPDLNAPANANANANANAASTVNPVVDPVIPLPSMDNGGEEAAATATATATAATAAATAATAATTTTNTTTTTTTNENILTRSVNLQEEEEGNTTTPTTSPTSPTTTSEQEGRNASAATVANIMNTMPTLDASSTVQEEGETLATEASTCRIDQVNGVNRLERCTLRVAGEAAAVNAPLVTVDEARNLMQLTLEKESMVGQMNTIQVPDDVQTLLITTPDGDRSELISVNGISGSNLNLLAFSNQLNLQKINLQGITTLNSLMLTAKFLTTLVDVDIRGTSISTDNFILLMEDINRGLNAKLNRFVGNARMVQNKPTIQADCKVEGLPDNAQSFEFAAEDPTAAAGGTTVQIIAQVNCNSRADSGEVLIILKKDANMKCKEKLCSLQSSQVNAQAPSGAEAATNA